MGSWRGDYRAAVVAYMVSTAWGGNRNAKLEQFMRAFDFTPEDDRPAQTPDEMMAVALQVLQPFMRDSKPDSDPQENREGATDAK